MLALVAVGLGMALGLHLDTTHSASIPDSWASAKVFIDLDRSTVFPFTRFTVRVDSIAEVDSTAAAEGVAVAGRRSPQKVEVLN